MPNDLRHTLARLAGRPYDPATDRELIARYHQTRDESAFAALVDKHGPMVLGVCRRKLKDAHAADDAFQATFLILAKKAGRVRWQESLGGWLYQVAVHVCRKVVARGSNRPTAPLTAAPEPAVVTPPPSELSAVLDEELNALPQAYRDPIILCHLEGLTVEEAAKALAVSEGQLRGRLFRGRERLRERLIHRGVALSVSALVVSLTAGTACGVSPALRSGVVANLAGSPPSPVLAVTREALATMPGPKVRLLVASAVLVAGLVSTGVVLNAVWAAAPTARVPGVGPRQPNLPEDDPKEEKTARHEGRLTGIDPKGNKLVLHTEEGGFDLPLVVGPKTRITLARRPARLDDLKDGMEARVTFRGNGNAPTVIEARWPPLEADLKAMDAAAGTVTVVRAGKAAVTFPLSADAEVDIDGVPAGFGDLKVGGEVGLEFSPDKKAVVRIEADGEPGDLTATVTAVDAANHGLTLAVNVAGPRESRAVDLTFPVAADCTVRLAGKPATLADLKDDMPVRCRFAADRRTITGVWAGPPKPAEKDD